MPLTELEELKMLAKQPLPGGRGYQEVFLKRKEYLREKVFADLIESMVDANGATDLAVMYIEAICGQHIDSAKIVLTEEFQEIWDSYHPRECEENTGE